MRELAWDSGEDEDEDGPKKGGLRIVVIKHLFHPDDAKNDPRFYDDLKLEAGQEIEAKSGTIEKLTVFEGSPLGAVAVKFKSSAGAEECIKFFNGRFFAGRKLEVEYFDGKTNYKVKDKDDDEAKRLKAFGDWLETDGNEAAAGAGSGSATAVPVPAASTKSKAAHS